jgi:hypothetical protein
MGVYTAITIRPVASSLISTARRIPSQTVKMTPKSTTIYSGLRANYPISNDLPPLEDAEFIQIAISLILRALPDASIEHKQAALMLYALQIATNNVRAVRLPLKSLSSTSLAQMPALRLP